MDNQGESIMENKIRYLEMLTSVIERMASYSFMLKGWGITIVAGMFILAEKDMDQIYLLFAYVPLVTFWFLDSYYLQLERKYRALYNIARTKKEEDIDFNMDAPNSTDKKLTYIDCLFSTIEWGFYVPIIMITAIIIMCR